MSGKTNASDAPDQTIGQEFAEPTFAARPAKEDTPRRCAVPENGTTIGAMEKRCLRARKSQAKLHPVVSAIFTQNKRLLVHLATNYYLLDGRAEIW